MRKIGSPFNGFDSPFGRQSSKGAIGPIGQWITDGSEVQQAPEGPTVIWAVNGSFVSNTEV